MAGAEHSGARLEGSRRIGEHGASQIDAADERHDPGDLVVRPRGERVLEVDPGEVDVNEHVTFQDVRVDLGDGHCWHRVVAGDQDRSHEVIIERR